MFAKSIVEYACIVSSIRYKDLNTLDHDEEDLLANCIMYFIQLFIVIYSDNKPGLAFFSKHSDIIKLLEETKNELNIILSSYTAHAKK